MKIVAKTECEQCGCSIYIEESQRGRTVACPSCGSEYSVDEATGGCVDAAPPIGEAESGAESDRSSKELATDGGPIPTREFFGSSSNTHLQMCTVCGEPMALTAPTCPHCGAPNRSAVDDASRQAGGGCFLALALGTVGLFLGLMVGYGIFGEIQGNYVPIQFIFSAKTGLLEGFMSSLCRLPEMREKILLCGVAGGVVGLILGMIGCVKK